LQRTTDPLFRRAGQADPRLFREMKRQIAEKLREDR
jgi:hypothetical protein